MMADMHAMDKVLDEKVARMNAATGEERLSAVIDVINEFVPQRKIMREKMPMMQENIEDSVPAE
ncbi:MAG: hypothetical protein PHP23_04030 [Desulfobacterales bacterium]|nr:hypothetical protein [Desulfobacterales bacterium]MDD4071509.1 hypothetical protein [Desulfobacterales bacterium]MDD4392951.1 hypothetical protein [Desulfobacterales bacterium]